jgi:transposase
MDIEIRCFMKPEVGDEEKEVQSRVPGRGGEAGPGTWGVGGASDLDVHEDVLRKWVKEFGSDPAQAFPATDR